MAEPRRLYCYEECEEFIDNKIMIVKKEGKPYLQVLWATHNIAEVKIDRLVLLENMRPEKGDNEGMKVPEGIGTLIEEGMYHYEAALYILETWDEVVTSDQWSDYYEIESENADCELYRRMNEKMWDRLEAAKGALMEGVDRAGYKSTSLQTVKVGIYQYLLRAEHKYASGEKEDHFKIAIILLTIPSDAGLYRLWKVIPRMDRVIGMEFVHQHKYRAIVSQLECWRGDWSQGYPRYKCIKVVENGQPKEEALILEFKDLLSARAESEGRRLTLQKQPAEESGAAKEHEEKDAVERTTIPEVQKGGETAVEVRKRPSIEVELSEEVAETGREQVHGEYQADLIPVTDISQIGVWAEYDEIVKESQGDQSDARAREEFGQKIMKRMRSASTTELEQIKASFLLGRLAWHLKKKVEHVISQSIVVTEEAESAIRKILQQEGWTEKTVVEWVKGCMNTDGARVYSTAACQELMAELNEHLRFWHFRAAYPLWVILVCVHAYVLLRNADLTEFGKEGLHVLHPECAVRKLLAREMTVKEREHGNGPMNHPDGIYNLVLRYLERRKLN